MMLGWSSDCSSFTVVQGQTLDNRFSLAGKGATCRTREEEAASVCARTRTP